VLYFQAPVGRREMRVEINTPVTTDAFSFAVSPDGQRLVFVASANDQPQLWVRPLDAVNAQPLSGTEGASYPFWSPDSRSIGFFSGGKLRRIDISGGLPGTLANAEEGRVAPGILTVLFCFSRKLPVVVFLVCWLRVARR
jgi:hypothetical protein